MEKAWVELSLAFSSEEILKLFIARGGLNIIDLKDGEACRNLKIGKLLGSGLNGKVYEIKDDESKGVEVVVKNVTLKESIIKHPQITILHETFCEIIMSAYFNRLYEGTTSYSLNFPYFQGFFSCGKEAQIVMEKLDLSLYDYLYSKDFKASTFAGLLFQLSFSLLLLRKEKIMHNDLHTRNLMIVNAKGRKYKNMALSGNFLYYGSKGVTYGLPNAGKILKFVDFDFAARHSKPKLCPQKLWTRPKDVYNVSYEWRPDYDLMVILAFLVEALFVRKALSSELDKARIVLKEWIADLGGGKMTIAKFMSNFNETVNRPKYGKEFLGLRLNLDYWVGKYGITKNSASELGLVGRL